MTTYAKLLRAAATLKRVRAGLDSLAAHAQTEEERERLRRAAAQARVMEQGLERRIRQVAAEEPEYARQAPDGPLPGVADRADLPTPPAGEKGEKAGSRDGAGRRGRNGAEPQTTEPVAAGRGAAGGKE